MENSHYWAILAPREFVFTTKGTSAFEIEKFIASNLTSSNALWEHRRSSSMGGVGLAGSSTRLTPLCLSDALVPG